jgi:ribonuclease R
LELARLLARDLGQKPRAPEGGGVPSARAIRSILKPLSRSPLRRALDYLLLRAMMQARYSSENVGHYSLASNAYTHFTSPIRRYPDLAVHRLLKAHLQNPRFRPDDVEAERQHTALDDLAADCSEKERRATEIERSVRSLFTAWLVKDRIGDRFSGAVSGCASFGAFVRVEDPFVEGLVRAQSIGTGLFEYDELRMRLTAHSGFSVGVGDVVEVELTGVDTERRQVTFKLVRITQQHGKATDIVPPERAERVRGRGQPRSAGRDAKKGNERKGRSRGDDGSKKGRSGRRGRQR